LRESVCECERVSVYERERVRECFLVIKRARVREKVREVYCDKERERERGSVCVCVCVCVRERERERKRERYDVLSNKISLTGSKLDAKLQMSKLEILINNFSSTAENNYHALNSKLAMEQCVLIYYKSKLTEGRCDRVNRTNF
jgi:hypothetical protein